MESSSRVISCVPSSSIQFVFSLTGLLADVRVEHAAERSANRLDSYGNGQNLGLRACSRAQVNCTHPALDISWRIQSVTLSPPPVEAKSPTPWKHVDGHRVRPSTCFQAHTRSARNKSGFARRRNKTWDMDWAVCVLVSHGSGSDLGAGHVICRSHLEIFRA